MKTKSSLITKIILSSGAAFALASGVWLLNTARAAENLSEPAKHAPEMCHLTHINTQTQAEALRASIQTEVTFEDGRKGIIEGDVRVVDMKLHAVAAQTPVKEAAE